MAAAVKPNFDFTWLALSEVWLTTVPKGTCPLRCGSSIVRAKFPAPITSSRPAGAESCAPGDFDRLSGSFARRRRAGWSGLKKVALVFQHHADVLGLA